MFDANGTKVGVIAAVTPTAILSSQSPNVTFSDPFQSISATIQLLSAQVRNGPHSHPCIDPHQSVSIIILLSHLGYQADLQLSTSLTDLDLIVSSHSHVVQSNVRSVRMRYSWFVPTS